MTTNDFKRAKELHSKIEKLESAICRINYSFEHKSNTKSTNGCGRLFVRFWRRKKMDDTGSDSALLFFPENLHAVDIDLEEDFVLLLLDWLEKKRDSAKEEFEELGK